MNLYIRERKINFCFVCFVVVAHQVFFIFVFHSLQKILLLLYVFLLIKPTKSFYFFSYSWIGCWLFSLLFALKNIVKREEKKIFWGDRWDDEVQRHSNDVTNWEFFHFFISTWCQGVENFFILLFRGEQREKSLFSFLSSIVNHF